MRLSLYQHRQGVEAGEGELAFSIERDEATFGPASVGGHALVWRLEESRAAAPESASSRIPARGESLKPGRFAAGAARGSRRRGSLLLSHRVELDPAVEWLWRCDRVDFPPGGIAYLHTHPGPGIRYLLQGSLEVHTAGRSTTHHPGSAWFESGPEPVLALASPEEDTAFVRAMVLPREWEGRRTIRYLDLADEAKPKLQRATVFLERPLDR